MICNRALAGPLTGSRVSRVASRGWLIPADIGPIAWSIAAPAPRRAAVAARAAADNGQFAFEEGAAVKVVAPIKVYHVPKHAEVQLEGMSGVVKKIAALHKGAVLSANLQYRVQFQAKLDGGDVKFFAHLAEEELEAV